MSLGDVFLGNESWRSVLGCIKPYFNTPGRTDFFLSAGGKEVFCCMLEISFDVMQSAAIAALVALVGRAIV